VRFAGAGRKLVLAAAVQALVVPACAQERANQVPKGQFGDLLHFIGADITKIRSKKFLYTLSMPDGDVTLSIRLFRKMPGVSDDYENKCVARPPDQIACDLGLIDRLLSDFGLTRQVRQNVRWREQLVDLRLQMLKWIIAHEIGHLVRKHPASGYAPEARGVLVYSAPQQAYELEADAVAINLIGQFKDDVDAKTYGFILAVINALIVRSLCPDQSRTCTKINPGVGILWNTGSDEPIKIAIGGKHPSFVARFLRIVLLAADDGANVGFSNLARSAIDKLLIVNETGVAMTIRDVVVPQDGRP
jgi:hypothetical protein